MNKLNLFNAIKVFFKRPETHIFLNWSNGQAVIVCCAKHKSNDFQISPICMTKTGPTSEKICMNRLGLWLALTHPDLFSFQTCKEHSSSCCLSVWSCCLLEECWASSVCWHEPTCCSSWPECCFCSVVSITLTFTSDWSSFVAWIFILPT